MKKYFVFDFDSTLTQVEALDYLAEIALKNDPKKKEIVNKIKNITDRGIDGEISFTTSLEERLKLIEANQTDLDLLVKKLKRKVSKSISRNKEFFKKNADNIYVISCGFKEFIDPIVKAYNIESERVFANTFKFNKKGKIIGFDDQNVLSHHNGKIECLKQLELPGKVFVIGDGYSDYVMKEAGIADKFFAYTENVERGNILDKADHVTPSFDEFLYVNKLPMNISYPKNRIKILLLENVHSDAVANLKEEGYSVEVIGRSLDEDELIEKIKDVHVIGIRSKTQITKKVLAAAPKLLAVGTFCIGTKQVDLVECQKRGVAVFNAPYSNTRSVVELAIGQMIMLGRSTFVRSTEMHNKVWAKTAEGSVELRGKTLGIIGYGNIGSQLSVLAESLGMKVIYYDVVEKLALGNAVKCNTLRELYKKSDVISVHVDDHANNKNLIGKKAFDSMKDGVVFINLSRGFVVDINALAEALKSGKVKGAAVDVFPKEPKENKSIFESPLQGIPNVILTPHVGGSTMEAQKDIADFVPKRLMDYINTGNSFESVNFPNIRLPEQLNSHRFLHIHKNVSGVMAEINKVLANYDLNIVGQYLKTNEEIGYLITDVDKDYPKEVVETLKNIPNTVKFRVLY